MRSISCVSLLLASIAVSGWAVEGTATDGRDASKASAELNGGSPQNTNSPSNKEEAQLQARVYSIRNRFLSAVSKRNGGEARTAQDEFQKLRDLHSDFFRERERRYRMGLLILKGNDPQLVPTALMGVPELRNFVWETVYEDASKLGISPENIMSILESDPHNEKLLKLKRLKDDGLITEQEFEAKRKAIISDL